jgi:hypothetical protein
MYATAATPTATPTPASVIGGLAVRMPASDVNFSRKQISRGKSRGEQNKTKNSGLSSLKLMHNK